MRKIAFTNNFEGYRQAIADKLPGWELVMGSGADIAANLSDIEILLGWVGSKEALENAHKLKWIQVLSAGVDSVPFSILKERGIMLTTASGVHANPISETILGMMLGFSRRLFSLHEGQLNNIWGGDYSGGQVEIHGKTLGIIGAGAIGSETAKLAKAFNMRVLGFRRSGGKLENFDKMYGPGELGEMLSQSDYVANILPATKDTIGLIGASEFEAMKNTAVYINVGRGKTTDTSALINALEIGGIAAAGLDVTDPEPLPADSPLWGMKNVLITSHTAGGTDMYMERAMEIFFSNLEDYLAGRALGRNLVDLDLQY